MTFMSTRNLAAALDPEHRFDWPVCHEAENYVLEQLEHFVARNAFARDLSRRMTDETGTLLLDWVDSLSLPVSNEATIRGLGYVPEPNAEAPKGQQVYHHPESMLPRLVLDEAHDRFPNALNLHPESVVDFMGAHAVTGAIEGGPLTGFRRALVSDDQGTCLYAIERRGTRSFIPCAAKPGQTDRLLRAHELWQTRQRRFDNDDEGYALTFALIDELVSMVGRDLACHVVFSGERIFWERRNRAGRVQKARQDALGLGWGNHDHHTFRSSRAQFIHLMKAMEKLGFERRERYYAGDQAGWGAQIMEQHIEGIVVFCDVDLMPHETQIDFSREPLPVAPKLGTIGLWTGLHGESFLEAGMHHLEARFDHALCREQLATMGVNTMKPFSDFEFLKQAFTEGERWPVRRERAQRLLDQNLIDLAQFDKFTTEGAIGSHLENLQRKGGFKGFNQQSVSAIIAAVDPRKHAGQSP
jgi:hypothetical protein